MISIPPFDILPLSSSPYFSRINGNYDTTFGGPKNYYLIGFKPGFPLQASELNELQEQFYLQQTLTNTCISNWQDKGMPFWPGATPLDPNYFTISGTGTTRTVTITPGWFYVNIPTSTSTSGFGIWIWNKNTFSSSINFPSAAINGTQYGLYLDVFTAVDYTADTNLSDNSGGGSSIKTSGADRIRINVIGYSEDATATANNFFPIFKVLTKAGTPITYDLVTLNGGVIQNVS